jgi:Tol biopolymer transport system component
VSYDNLTGFTPLSSIMLIAIDGSQTNTPYRGTRPKWSPDGRWFAFEALDAAGNNAVYAARAGRVPAQLIVNSQGEISSTGEWLSEYAWAPDSSRLAYIQQGPLSGTGASRGFGPDPLHTRLYTVRPDGSDRQLLLQIEPFPNGLLGPIWSPDGRYLLYLYGIYNGGCFEIHLFTLATGRDTALHGTCYLPRTLMPDWSPDGRYLVFSAQPNSIMLLDVAEALRHPQDVGGLWLTGGDDLTFDPIWQPGSH